MMKKYMRFSFAILMMMVATAVFIQCRSYLNLAFLQQQQLQIKTTIANQFWYAMTVFMLLYILTCACALPFGGILTLSGGYFLGLVNTAIIACIGATIGAIIAFLLARYVLQESIERRYPKQISWLNAQLNKHGAHYLLFIRLMPFMPYFIINPVAGLTRISLFTFAWTMAVGVIPGSVVLALAGREFAQVNSLSGIISWNIAGALSLLAMFALLPIIIKRNRGEESQQSFNDSLKKQPGAGSSFSDYS